MLDDDDSLSRGKYGRGKLTPRPGPDGNPITLTPDEQARFAERDQDPNSLFGDAIGRRRGIAAARRLSI